MSRSQKSWKEKYIIEVSGVSRSGDTKTFAEEIFEGNIMAILRAFKSMFTKTKIILNKKELK